MYALQTDRTFDGVSLVVAFDGWVDAAQVGSTAAEWLAGDGAVVATFDPDALFDYRVNRPTVDFIDGRLVDFRYPKVVMQAGSIGGREVLVMRGTEPEFQWKALGECMVELTGVLGVPELICIGSVPAAVSHTRPTNVLNTSSTADFVSMGERSAEGLLRVPGAAATNIEWHLAQTGMNTYGFWAQVPHYVSGPFFQGVIALLERLGRHLGVDAPTGRLLEEAIEQREQLDRLVAGNPEIRAHLERLEMLADPDDLPTAEEIGTEIENFLRDTGDD